MKDNVAGFLQPRVKGVATVSFDGEVVARRENFVSPRMLGSLATFGNRFLIAPTSATSSPAAGGLLGSTSPFSGLVLTDFDQEPDPTNEVAISGTALAGGTINTTASGSSRGNFNVPESVFESGYQRLVWDFATNQANGTFQSIYLFPGSVSASTGTPDGYVSSVGGTTLESGMAASLNKDGDWYYFVSSGTLYRYDFNNLMSYFGGYSRSAENLGALPGASSNSGAFVKDGTAYWVQAASPYNIRSAPITDLATFTNIRTHPAGVNYAGNNYGCSVSYWAEVGGWVVGNRSTSGSWTFAKLHDDFTDWEVYGTSGVTSLSSMSPCWGSTTTSTNVSTSSGIYAVSDVDYSIQQTWVKPTSSVPTFYPISADLGVASTGTSNTNKSTASSLFFSRALLEEPVTKTSVNTMKITYELVWG